MQRVLVAEIGNMTTVVSAFGDLDTKNPRLLGQGLFPTTVLEGDIGIGLRSSVTNLENDIGPVSSLGEIPFYATVSLPARSAVQEVSEQYILDAQTMREISQIIKDRSSLPPYS